MTINGYHNAGSSGRWKADGKADNKARSGAERKARTAVTRQ